MADFVAGEPPSNGTHSATNSVHSRESSMSSERSTQDKENTNAQTNTLTRQDSDASSASGQQLILRDGGQLVEESRTEAALSGVYENHGLNGFTVKKHLQPEKKDKKSLMMADKKNKSTADSKLTGSQQNGSDPEDTFLQKYGLKTSGAAGPGSDVITLRNDAASSPPEERSASETGPGSVGGQNTRTGSPATNGGEDVPASPPPGTGSGQSNGSSSASPRVNGSSDKSDHQVSKHGHSSGALNGNSASTQLPVGKGRHHYTKSGNPSASNLLKAKSASRESLVTGSRESLNSTKSGASVKSGSGSKGVSGGGASSSSSSSPNDVTTRANPNYVKHGATQHHRDRSPGANSNHSMKNGASDSSSGIPEVPSRQATAGGGTGTARHKVNKTGSSNLASTIPEEEISIPNDGNLVAFSADAMATFLRYLRVEDRLVNHLHRNGLDGRKFGRLKDSDLDNLQLKNPVVAFFRDKTAPAANKKPKQRLPFVL